jgi:hypothetical protein
MKPSNFPQANVLLQKPPSMTEEECSSLPAHRFLNMDAFVSCWRPTWRERFAILFGLPLWVWVFGGRHHPPIAVEVQNPWVDDLT